MKIKVSTLILAGCLLTNAVGAFADTAAAAAKVTDPVVVSMYVLED